MLYQIDFKTQARRASATREEEGGAWVWHAVARRRKLLHFNSREETKPDLLSDQTNMHSEALPTLVSPPSFCM